MELDGNIIAAAKQLIRDIHAGNIILHVDGDSEAPQENLDRLESLLQQHAVRNGEELYEPASEAEIEPDEICSACLNPKLEHKCEICRISFVEGDDESDYHHRDDGPFRFFPDSPI